PGLLTATSQPRDDTRTPWPIMDHRVPRTGLGCARSVVVEAEQGAQRRDLLAVVELDHRLATRFSTRERKDLSRHPQGTTPVGDDQQVGRGVAASDGSEGV